MGINKEIARGSATVSIITFIGHILSTALKLLVSFNYGLTGFGQFVLVMAYSKVLSNVIDMGYHQSIVHFVSRFRTKEDWVNASHFFLTGFLHIIIFSLLIFVGLLILGDQLIQIINPADSGTQLVLFISAIATIIAANNFLSGTLRSLRFFKEQAILFTSAFPAIMIISMVISKWVLNNQEGISQFLALGITLNVIMLIIVFFLTKINIAGRITDHQEKLPSKQLTRYSMPIWFSSILQSAFKSSDRIMLGMMSSIAQVGVYGAGLTFSILFAFPLKAMGPVFQPYIIDRYSENDFEGMNKLYNTMVRWSSLFVIPAFGALICFGDHLVLLFGKDFKSAYNIMIILSFAQIISTVSGIAGTMLNMTEKQNSHAKIMLYGFLFAIGLNLLLIPEFGALGAAAGTAIASIVINIFRVRKMIKYYKLKTDYSIVFSLSLKFLILVLATSWLNQQAQVHWIILLVIFSLISLVILFFSLSKVEKAHLMTLARNRL
ncbi:MAG: polysaccharide biosynthesis C-terminal domain-containing protein [Candidatus Marinimicrobia bacterium]|nr:polysaccharide biosynthesis C-terminal domain-containing protein [Candidatus Neomarinimicrobiota bacterium]